MRHAPDFSQVLELVYKLLPKSPGSPSTMEGAASKPFPTVEEQRKSTVDTGISRNVKERGDIQSSSNGRRSPIRPPSPPDDTGTSNGEVCAGPIVARSQSPSASQNGPSGIPADERPGLAEDVVTLEKHSNNGRGLLVGEVAQVTVASTPLTPSDSPGGSTAGELDAYIVDSKFEVGRNPKTRRRSISSGETPNPYPKSKVPVIDAVTKFLKSDIVVV